MPKAQRANHNPLAEEYSPSHPFKHKSPKKRKSRHDDENENENNVIDTKASRKILSIGQDLADEDVEEQKSQLGQRKLDNNAFSFDSAFEPEAEPESSDDNAFNDNDDDDEAWGNEEEVEEIMVDDMDPADLETFNRFNPPTFHHPMLGEGAARNGNGQSTNLADLILEKIAEHEAQAANVGRDMMKDGDDYEEEEGKDGREEEDFEEEAEIPPKVLEVYTKIGHLLSRYKSGKLPKAFKIMPTLPPAMQHAVLPLTHPESWTNNAVYEATRLFISAAPSTAQFFVNTVLLDRVREDIHDTRQLNVHLYKALRKSLYKPAAFFKGLLFPMLQTGSCTLREAAIVSSAIARVSVPALHAAAALSRCCDIAADQMARDPDAAGSTNLCIKVLLEKRYALPYQTIDSLVFHFLRFRPQTTDDAAEDLGRAANQASHGKLPVIWHQCLLAFAQRYRNDIAEEQREALLDLLLVRGHKDIGPEIRRELLAGRGRGTLAMQEPGGNMDGGDDTLMAVA